MTKTLNQIIFFFLHQNQNSFFSNIGNQNIFLEKNHYPPPLQVKWSFPKGSYKMGTNSHNPFFPSYLANVLQELKEHQV